MFKIRNRSITSILLLDIVYMHCNITLYSIKIYKQVNENFNILDRYYIIYIILNYNIYILYIYILYIFIYYMIGLVVHVCNPSMLEVEAGGSQV